MHPDFESFDMRGHALRYLCRGKGTPTVIIEQGGGVSVERSFLGPVAFGWRKVFETLSRTHRTLLHDRAGLGWSYRPTRPRSCSRQVRDLRALLRHLGVGPPYLLVGHSIGGFNVRLFAHQHPDEVIGVVLVDATHPDQWSRFARLISRLASGEPAAARMLRQRAVDPALTPELIDYVASADEVRTAGTLGNTPLIVLSRSPNALRMPGMPADMAEMMEEAWTGLQRDLLNLSTRSAQVVATHAGHHIEQDEPQLLTQTILKLLRDTSAPRPVLH